MTLVRQWPSHELTTKKKKKNMEKNFFWLLTLFEIGIFCIIEVNMHEV